MDLTGTVRFLYVGLPFHSGGFPKFDPGKKKIALSNLTV